jgi:hypothetical protein
MECFQHFNIFQQALGLRYPPFCSESFSPRLSKYPARYLLMEWSEGIGSGVFNSYRLPNGPAPVGSQREERADRERDAQGSFQTGLLPVQDRWGAGSFPQAEPAE